MVYTWYMFVLRFFDSQGVKVVINRHRRRCQLHLNPLHKRRKSPQNWLTGH